jgi:polyferredoxin
VDVCNEVMDKVQYPRGLIRYSTHHAMEEQQPVRVLRPRVAVYGTLLLALLIGFGTAVANRSTLIVDVIRDRNTLYRELPGGLIENVYTITFVNKTEVERSYDISVRGIDGLELGVDVPLPLMSGPGEVRRIPLRLTAPAGAVPGGGAEVALVVEARGDAPTTIVRNTRFIGPVGPQGTPR